jgi:hypothetical protein
MNPAIPEGWFINLGERGLKKLYRPSGWGVSAHSLLEKIVWPYLSLWDEWSVWIRTRASLIAGTQASSFLMHLCKSVGCYLHVLFWTGWNISPSIFLGGALQRFNLPCTTLLVVCLSCGWLAGFIALLDTTYRLFKIKPPLFNIISFNTMMWTVTDFIKYIMKYLFSRSSDIMKPWLRILHPSSLILGLSSLSEVKSIRYNIFGYTNTSQICKLEVVSSFFITAKFGYLLKAKRGRSFTEAAFD